MIEPCEELGGAEVMCAYVNGEKWIKARDVFRLLGYACCKSAASALHPEHMRTSTELNLDVIRNGGCPPKFINTRGVKQLLSKSRKPKASAIAERSGMEVMKYLRPETEILCFLEETLTVLNIPFEFQKSVLRYKIDLYLPVQRIAIEIDENGHRHRDEAYERQRERDITQLLCCKFLRFNPDDPKFKLALCVGKVCASIFTPV